MWSARIYDLTDFLVARGKPVVCMDWGLCNNLEALSKGALETSDQWHEFLYPLQDLQPMEDLLSKSEDALYVFHSPKYTGVLVITDQDYPRKTFFQTAESIGANVQLMRTFDQANGESLYEIYVLRAG